MCVCEFARLPRQPACCRCQLSAASLPLGTDWKGDEGCFLPSASAHSQAVGSRRPRTNIDTTHSASMAATDVDVFSVSHWPRRSLLFTLLFFLCLIYFPLSTDWRLYSGSRCAKPSRVFCLASRRRPRCSQPVFSQLVCVCMRARDTTWWKRFLMKVALVFPPVRNGWEVVASVCGFVFTIAIARAFVSECVCVCFNVVTHPWADHLAAHCPVNASK